MHRAGIAAPVTMAESTAPVEVIKTCAPDRIDGSDWLIEIETGPYEIASQEAGTGDSSN